MSERMIEIEANSLDEARSIFQSQIPDGFRLISEQILSDGRITITKVADTEEEAYSKAQEEIPINAETLERKVVTASQRKLITIEELTESSAMTWAQYKVRDQFGADAHIKTIKQIIAGRNGFLGIGKRVSKYEAEVIIRQAVVEITYKAKPKISFKLGDIDALLAVGQSYFNQGDYDHAASFFHYVDALGGVEGTFRLGLTYQKQQYIGQAELAWKQAEKQGHPGAIYSLGVLLFERGDQAGGEEAFRRADDLGYGDASNRLGQILYERNNIVDAERAWRRAYKRGHAEGALNLGLLLVNREDFGDAGAVLESVRSLTNDNDLQARALKVLSEIRPALRNGMPNTVDEAISILKSIPIRNTNHPTFFKEEYEEDHDLYLSPKPEWARDVESTATELLAFLRRESERPVRRERVLIDDVLTFKWIEDFGSRNGTYQLTMRILRVAKDRFISFNGRF